MARFARAETGSMTIFALMFMMLMLMMGGIAVDLMRFEARRTALQNTLDRSTLAAASLTQDREAKVVVEDYFRKAGMTSFLRSVTVTRGLNFRNVDADADAETNPMFLTMMGIHSMDAFGASQAEQRINNVEIMLVLDVSGSMASNSKLVNLKNAANSFVTAVLTNDLDHKISIGIVPFNGQVNLGPTLRGRFTVTDLNGLPAGSSVQPGVDCVDLPAAAYTSYAVPTNLALSMTANSDTYSGSGTMTPSEANKWCPTVNGATYYVGNPPGTGGNIVRLPKQDIATLQGYINGLSAVGATSINAGMKWGMTLLDPTMQSTYTAAITAGTMPATMADRPLAYDTEDAMKVIVLMTDGENFAEERLNAGFKTGMSPLWQATSDSRWSIFHASRVTNTNATTLCNSRPFWVPHLAAWHSRAWNGTAPLGTDCYDPLAAVTGTTNRTWPDVWSRLGMQYVAQNFYATPGIATFSTQMGLFRTQTSTTSMNTQMQAACTAAKDAKVIVYGIAFEAPVNGQTQIRDCATSAAHYFDANGIQISNAFAAIANNISQLRLTQ